MGGLAADWSPDLKLQEIVMGKGFFIHEHLALGPHRGAHEDATVLHERHATGDAAAKQDAVDQGRPSLATRGR